MDARELRELVEGHETQTLELKANLQKSGDLADLFMQFANAQGAMSFSA